MAIDVKVPGVGESVQEGMIASWAKKSGDKVEQDEPLCALETDKATVDVPSPESGTLQILVEAGKVVKVGEVIARIEASQAKSKDSKAEPKEIKKEEPKKEKAPEPAQPAKSAQKETASTQKENGPAVRRMVKEMGVDLKNVEAHGKDGRTTKSDIITSLDKSTKPEKTDKTEKTVATTKPAQATAKAAPTGHREETREPMSMLRRKIARRLVESQQTAAILTTFNEVDMSNIIALRNKYKDGFEKRYGIKLGFMGFFLKASVWALQEFPRVNAYIDGDDIVYHNYCDIGVAVSTEKGLLVPILKNVDQMSLKDIEEQIVNFSVKARNNKITVDDITGGTFTVSNGGIFGSLLSTPIINPPQTAILGMHKIQQRAVVLEDGRIEARPMMYLALSYDHRLIDGKEAVQFLVKIKETIEDPSRLLLGV